MSLLFRKPAEERSLSFQDVWGSGVDASIRATSVGAALRLAPVYAATSLIADQIATSPWSVYAKSDGVPKKLSSQPRLVTDPGANGIDLYSWKFQAIVSVLLQGNAYGYVLTRDQFASPATVLWLKPDEVEIDESGDMPAFYWNGRLIPRDRLIHLPGYVLPGSVKGLSPIGLFRTQIETGMEAQSFGRKFFKRGTTPSGVLQNTSKSITAEQASAAKSRFIASVSSSEPFVVGADWSYESISVPAGDASFLTGIKATANQIAAIYRVAPEDVGGEANGSSLTYKNLEQDQIKFAVRTLQPWSTRFEMVFNRVLPPNQYSKFNLDASARSDMKTRYESHRLAITTGFETIDEARALEEREPLTPAEFEMFKAYIQPIAPPIAS